MSINVSSLLRSLIIPGMCVIILNFLLAPSAEASKKRGIWFWGDSSSPYGSVNIVGNNVLENQTIAFFKSKKIKLVYGSYGNRLVTESNVIAQWNVKLHEENMESQSLMSQNTWIYPTNRPNLLTKISDRLLTFNNFPGRPADEKFDALHLDIEPQGLTNWSDLTSTEKRDHLLLLRDTFVDVRQHLVNEGEPNFRVYADLPVWFDNLPVDGGSIGWANATQRNQWFADVADALTGITFMPFKRDTIGSITNGLSWEMENISGASIRIGHLVDVGDTWPTLADFNDMMETMEGFYGTRATDIQKYSDWREEINAQPIMPATAFLQLATPLSGTIVIPTETNWIYSILHSSDLCLWKEVHRVKARDQGQGQGQGRIIYPVQFRGRQGYWKIQRFQERRQPR